MPLMTRRSSTRSTPRTSVGKNGSIRFHCSSLSQKGTSKKYPFRAACKSDSKNLFEFDHRERVRWGNWVSLI
jgi:hypothetical protein